MTEALYGAIEAGGTKILCSLFDGQHRQLASARIATAEPADTLPAIFKFFEQTQVRHGRLAGLGIASFGPLRLDRSAPDYGCLLATPKPGWSGFDLLGAFRHGLDVPVGLDTDVNAAAVAEQRWGAGQGLEQLVYVTVGTGIGGGAIVAGRPVHGRMHPELGHLRPRRHREDQAFAGSCPFHGDCFEGLASGTAIVARCGAALNELSPDHPVWRIEADYLGQLCAQIALSFSPQRIILGGGVMQQPALFSGIRERLRHWLGDYLPALGSVEDLADFVVAPGLGQCSGILGALALAIQAQADACPRQQARSPGAD